MARGDTSHGDGEGIKAWSDSVPTVSQVVKEILADIKSLLQKYDGSEADKKAIAEAHIQINRQYDSLQNSLYLTQQEKDSLAAIHQNAESCWKALEEGKSCDSTVNTTGAATAVVRVFTAAVVRVTTMSQICGVGNAARGTCACKINKNMSSKLNGNKAQVRNAQCKGCILAPLWGRMGLTISPEMG